MLTDLQRSKMQNRFKMLDAEGEGFIKESDFDLLADRICQRFVPKEKPDLESEIRAGYEQMRDYLLQNCDTDADGRISPEEYLKAVDAGHLADPEHYDVSVGRALRALFKALDSNGDQRIVRDEFAPLGGTFGVGPDKISTIFDILDADHDGEVTLEEFEIAAKDFYLGDNPETAGGFVFGQSPGS